MRAPSLACSRMAFSSFDEPDAAVFLRDNNLLSKEKALSSVYKHVFGNVYLMEEDRAKLEAVENEFLLGKISVRELVCALALFGARPRKSARGFVPCGKIDGEGVGTKQRSTPTLILERIMKVLEITGSPVTLMRKNYDGCGTSIVPGLKSRKNPFPAQLIMGRKDSVRDIERIVSRLPSRFRVEKKEAAPAKSENEERVAEPQLAR
ncbi:Phycobilisome linker [Gracilaria domingensis]|nr:Phycobilisome linker [Gracilaria domingensis]